MLVLGMRLRDSVIITIPPGYKGGQIKVSLLGFQHGHPRMGFAADRCITVDREEIHERKKAERGANGNVAEAADGVTA